MTFPGPRPIKEPSPPFRDPTPDKGKAISALKSGKKIVKLTTIGKSLKAKMLRKKANETLSDYHLYTLSDKPIFLKDAVKELFNLDDTNVYTSLTQHIDEKLRNKAKPEYIKVAKFLYDEAQKELSSMKKKTITLYRGVRGEENNSGTLVSSINSFSSNIKMARFFIKDSMASVNKIVKIEVPIDRIIATPKMIKRNIPKDMQDRSNYEYLVIGNYRKYIKK